MKKYIILGIAALIMIVPIAGAANIQVENEPNTSSYEDFTHTVFVEYGTMTTCGPCITASSQLYNIYNSGDLDFYYASLVWDEATFNVRSRLTKLGVIAVPDVYFDGGYKRVLGGQSTENPYRNAITQSGERTVPDIDINLGVTWLGGGKLKIEVDVINNEVEEFRGKLRTYVIEKESRWNDNGGNPYHYAVLDIPMDRSLTVSRNQPKPLGDTYTFSKTWYGSLYGFGDITQGNTIVIAAVFDKDTGYAVQAELAEPTANSNNQNTRYLTNPLLLHILEKILDRFPMIEQLLNL